MKISQFFSGLKSNNYNFQLPRIARTTSTRIFQLTCSSETQRWRNHKMAALNDVALIFTYGTLRRRFQNHPLMEDLMATRDVSFKGNYTTVDPFPLVLGPHGIPFLINKPGSGHRIPGELYSVSSRGLVRLDELEGIETGHYERLPVKVEADGGEMVAVEAYFAHRSFAEELWKKCGEFGLSEYSMEMGNNYVKRSKRPLGSTFVDDVWKFISNAD